MKSFKDFQQHLNEEFGSVDPAVSKAFDKLELLSDKLYDFYTGELHKTISRDPAYDKKFFQSGQKVLKEFHETFVMAAHRDFADYIEANDGSTGDKMLKDFMKKRKKR